MSEIRYGGRCEKHLSVIPCATCTTMKENKMTEQKPYAYEFQKLHDDSFGKGWETHIEKTVPNYGTVQNVKPLYGKGAFEELEKAHAIVCALYFGAICQHDQEGIPEDVKQIAGGVLTHILGRDSESGDFPHEETCFKFLREYLLKFPKVETTVI